jgi:hypothetical protein
MKNKKIYVSKSNKILNYFLCVYFIFQQLFLKFSIFEKIIF